MAQIISRNSEITSQDGFKKIYKVYNGNMYYKNKSGEYNSIDLSTKDSSSSVGDITLSNTRVMSMGIRKDSNPEKFLGIRPDETQEDGTNQLEFTIEKVIYDGVEQSIDLSKNEDVGNNRIDLGSILVESNMVGVTQMVKHDGSYKDFIIEYELCLKGMSIINNKYSSDYIFRKPVSFNSIDIGEGDLDYIWNYHKNNLLSDTDNKNITLMIGQFTGESIILGDKERDVEFNDSSLSGYNTIDIGMVGSSVYLKNAIALCFSFQNIEEELHRIAINNTCEALDLTPLVDNEHPKNTGQYLLNSSGEKVAGCHLGQDGSRFFIFINTEAISDSVKSLFKLKTFNNTGYLNTTISNIKSSLDSQFDYNMSSITLNSDYYKPNEEGSFIVDSGTDIEYKIVIPRVYNNNFDQVYLSTFHSIKHKVGDIYKYTKYLTTDGYLTRKLQDISYIDSTTNVNGNSDGWIRGQAAVTLTGNNSHNMRIQQTSVLGTSILDYSSSYVNFGELDVTTIFNFSNWFFFNPTFTFDTSSVSGTVTDVTLNIRTTGGTKKDDVTFAKQESELFNNVIGVPGDDSGASFYWRKTFDNAVDFPDIVIYNDSYDISAWGTNTSTYAYREIDMATAMNAEVGGTIQIQAFLDMNWTAGGGGGSSPSYSVGSNNNRWYGYNSSSGAYPPYLTITTEGEEEEVTYNATFFGANF